MYVVAGESRRPPLRRRPSVQEARPTGRCSPPGEQGEYMRRKAGRATRPPGTESMLGVALNYLGLLVLLVFLVTMLAFAQRGGG